MSELVSPKRALISVSDKTGVVEFASALQKLYGVELVSTGGTAQALRQAGLEVQEVADLTGFPELMDGRVKTLHPRVHGGLLAKRDDPEHRAAMEAHGIAPIDLVCVNLYPFEATTRREGCTFDDAVENIDIGGPAMIRSAAKNHRWVLVLTDPVQYARVLDQLERHGGQTPLRFRLDLAMWAFARTAQYDAAIQTYLGCVYFEEPPASPSRGTEGGVTPESAGLLPTLTPRLQRQEVLRYGENPHQLAAFYTDGSQLPGVATARQLHGKALSYINLLDADAAIELVREFAHPAAAVIKHTNPCGCAVAESLAEAFDLAYSGDPVAAFGGIVALNQTVDLETARRIVAGKRFLEVVIAPDFAPESLELLRDRWKDCRILAYTPQGATLAVGARGGIPLRYHSVTGGMLVQQSDRAGFDRASCVVTSKRQPNAREWYDLEFVWLVTKHVKSNAIVLAHEGHLLGTGAGQMSRPLSARIAVDLARVNGHSQLLAGAVAGSDAFFPFPDGPALLIEAGVTAIIHPGGSKKDQETIDLCNREGVALVATGQRHFAH